MSNASNEKFEVGMIGLGVMGRNFALNLADQGFSVSGHDKMPAQVEALAQEGAGKKIYSTGDLKDFLASLRSPRAIILLVPAGAPVDAVVKELLPHLAQGDLLIDAGNSFFKDTDLRIAALAKKGVQFMGVGVSGGEEGARRGPSIMPGGSKEAYERVRPLFEAASAKVAGEPCVTWLGPGASGHYVKMVHNGIEYGLMQLISETYDVMKRGLGLNDDEMADVFTAWDRGDANSYLVEITGKIFKKTDEKTGGRLIDVILDVAKQNGTGLWTSQSAMELKVPTPTLDLAVAMRDLSSLGSERQRAEGVYARRLGLFKGDRKLFIASLGHALLTGMILTYAQGFALLTAASRKYGYQLDLEAVARIWRGGCIIRAALLEDIRAAYRDQKDLPNLLLDPALARKVMEHEDDLRTVVREAAQLGLPIPGLMVSLGYLDAYRSAWLPDNLVQAQRDFFGSHTYERIDAQGTFHTRWEE